MENHKNYLLLFFPVIKIYYGTAAAADAAMLWWLLWYDARAGERTCTREKGERERDVGKDIKIIFRAIKKLYVCGCFYSRDERSLPDIQ